MIKYVNNIIIYYNYYYQKLIYNNNALKYVYLYIFIFVRKMILTILLSFIKNGDK